MQEAFFTLDSVVVAEDGVVDGGDVLPGFQLSLAELFARAEATGQAEDSK